MDLIGITGKSGSGKSYFADKLNGTIKNSEVINFDNIFSEVMNNEIIISRIYELYGDEAIKKGKINLDKILINKEMFDTIYKMIIEKVERRIRQEIEKSYLDGKQTVIIDWWGLPRSNIMKECDYVVYVDIGDKERVKSLKHREKHITQEDIRKRDEVLSVDYDKYNYDLVVLNDHKDKTINDAIWKIHKDLKLEIQEENTSKEKRKNFIQKISNKSEYRKNNLEASNIKNNQELDKDSVEEEFLE